MVSYSDLEFSDKEYSGCISLNDSNEQETKLTINVKLMVIVWLQFYKY